MSLQSNRFSVFGSLGRFVSGILRTKIVTATAETIATAISAIHVVMVAVWAPNGPGSNRDSAETIALCPAVPSMRS